MLGFVFAALGLLTVWALWTYNRLVRLRNACRSAWSQVDVQLRHRHDLVPRLVEVVKEALHHERTVIRRLVAARARAVEEAGHAEGRGQSPDVGRDVDPEPPGSPRLRAEGELDGATERLLGLAEETPALRGSESAALLLEDLESTENRIAFARQYYNERVRALNRVVRGFPATLVATATGIPPAPYYDVETGTDGEEIR